MAVLGFDPRNSSGIPIFLAIVDSSKAWMRGLILGNESEDAPDKGGK